LYRAIYSIAQWRFTRPLMVRGIANMNKFKPDQVVTETDSLICFHHPSPDYPVHILIVPKAQLRDLTQLDPGDSQFFKDLIETVQSLVEKVKLQEQGYRLVVNGGQYQEFPQLHFHLISGE
jgi:histidine triad (HIT) family protein